MLYYTMAHKDDPRPRRKIKKINEQAREGNRITSLLRHETGGDPAALEELQENSITRMKPNHPDYYPEAFAYDPKDKLKNGLVPQAPDAAKNIPEYWAIFRIHRLLRWGCPGKHKKAKK